MYISNRKCGFNYYYSKYMHPCVLNCCELSSYNTFKAEIYRIFMHLVDHKYSFFKIFREPK